MLAVLKASRIVNALLHMPIPIRGTNVWKKPRTFPNGLQIGFGMPIPEVILQLDKAAIFPQDERT